VKLSDVMSAAGLESWAELGLVVCFATFLALLFWLFVIRRGPVFETESRLPLADDDPAALSGAEPRPQEGQNP
jgi:cbb3-type cytochrome oxidase subunit 3